VNQMRKLLAVLVTASMILAGCGGGSDDDSFRDPAPPGGGPPPANSTVATITATTSTPTISSDGTQTAEIKAFARDGQNRFVTGADITFAANSGGIQVQRGQTQADGSAVATLSTAGDPSTRTIDVTASVGTLSSTVSVRVVGTRINVQGPQALSLTQVGNFTVSVIDSADVGLPNRQITLTSARGNAISTPTVTTDANGRAAFTVTVSNPGNDTITAATAGATGTAAISVADNNITFSAPTVGAEVPLNTAANITVTVAGGTNPQAVTFSSTRGALSSQTVQTNAAGQATTTVQSQNAGGATVTASAVIGGVTLSQQRTFEFVATTPATIDVQPSVFTLGINEESTLTAVVRDISGNLVKNRTVQFSLNDVTGGSITSAAAITDSQGRAQTVYRAGSTVSAQNGVIISVSIVGAPGVVDDVRLTVARKEVFISLGTGNSISELNPAQYRLPYAVQVTDASGNGVRNVPVVISVLSRNYIKGGRAWNGNFHAVVIAAVCQDEDLNRNGVLDIGEDFNGSRRIEAGNIVAATRNVVTDDAGSALISLDYPQDHADYVEVTLEARTSVQGTEFARSATFLLPALTADVNQERTSPPGPVSPFGIANNCANPN
jgi:hypothetical protein